MAKKETEEKLNMAQMLENINKEYGAGSVITLNEKPHGDYDVIPTGSIVYDDEVLGIGGFAKGRLYEIRGWEGCGKSSICGHLAAECQKQGGKVLYMDGEFALDTDYFANLGVDVDKLLISQPNNGTEGFDIALKLIGTGEIDLLIIDSDSSFLPKDVIENEVGSSNIGKKAKLNSDVYPKFKSIINKTNTCMVVTSQYRQQIGMMFGDPKITQGGKSLGYYADCIIDMSKTLKKEGEEVTANIVKIKTIKNKTYSPFKSGTTEVVFGIGINKLGEIIELGSKYELLKKWGKTITYGDNKFTIEDFSDLIRDNEKFKEEITDKIKKKIFNG